MIQWIVRHPVLMSAVGTWIFNNIVTVLISSLPAPTKDSSANYVYWFKVSNNFIGNLQRAHSTAIELSPNWQDAIEKHVRALGVQPAEKP